MADTEEIMRVFPRRTKWTPNDELAFIGEPPLFRPKDRKIPVMVSVTFTDDKAKGKRLAKSWSRYYDKVEVGGPAFDDPGGEFVRGRFLLRTITITSRGCPKNCPWCYVPNREGKIRELPISPGWVVQDNNLLACSKRHIKAVFDMLRQQPIPASFPGGLVLDYLKRWHIDLLKSIKVACLWVAFDTERSLRLLSKAKDLLADFGRERRRAYILIGYNGESQYQAEKRLGKVYDAGFLPFAMLYDKNRDASWKQLQRKWARPAIYKSMKSCG